MSSNLATTELPMEVWFQILEQRSSSTELFFALAWYKAGYGQEGDETTFHIWRVKVTKNGGPASNRDRLNFCKYQYRCSQVRKGVAAFPNILRHPGIWGQCRSHESAMFATNAQNTASIKDNPEEIEFELVQDLADWGNGIF